MAGICLDGEEGRGVRTLAVLLLLLPSSCALFQPPAAILPPSWVELEAAHFGDLRNVSKCGDVWFGGGVTEEDVELAYRRGVQSILDLSFPEEEPDFDLRRACADNGIALYDLDLLRAEVLSDRNANEALDLFRDTEHHPLLVVCGTASNGAAFFALWRALDHEVPFDEALEEARRAGMRPGPLETYVRAQFERLSSEEG